MNKGKSYIKVDRQNHYNGGSLTQKEILNDSKYYNGGMTPTFKKDEQSDQEIDTNTHLYYNGSFINTNPYLVNASMTDTRTSYILQRADEWVMSVIRFDVDCSALPINIPAMQLVGVPPLPSPTLTQSFITLRYHNVNYSQPIIYIEFFPALSPFPVIYNYQTWLDFVNTAAALAFTASGAVGSPPQFIYNPLTGLIDLYIDNNFLPAAGVNQITIFVNDSLLQYLYNFKYSVDVTSTLLKNKINITNTNTVILPAVGSRQNYPLSVQSTVNLNLTSETNASTSRWSSIRSLILTSNSIPFNNEVIIGSPTISGNYNSSSVYPILTDFLIPVENNVTDSRIIEQYLPTAQYRYIDLNSKESLFSINLNFSFSDYLGNIYPLPLITNGAMNIKILFQKRDTVINTPKIKNII